MVVLEDDASFVVVVVAVVDKDTEEVVVAVAVERTFDAEERLQEAVVVDYYY